MVISVADALARSGYGTSRKGLAIAAQRLGIDRNELREIDLSKLSPKERAEALAKLKIDNYSIKQHN